MIIVKVLIMTNEVGICTKCKVNPKMSSNFWCHDCHNTLRRANYKAKSPLDRKIINAKKLYGISKNKLLSMIKTCSNRCQICQNEFSNVSQIYIDHCHNTKVVRGLLCSYCNFGIGQFKDSITLLQNAINYLK